MVEGANGRPRVIAVTARGAARRHIAGKATLARRSAAPSRDRGKPEEETMLNASVALDHAALAEEIPLDEIDVSDPKLYQQDVWPPYFRRLRRDAPVHYCKDSPLGPFWSVTKYKDIVDAEVESQDALVELRARRHHVARQAGRARTADVHRHGSAAARGPAEGGSADRLAGQSRQFRGPDPQPGPHGARWSAARRNVRLGGQGLGRTDRADAGDAVRLPVRGSAQAERLVGLSRPPSRTRAQ